MGISIASFVLAVVAALAAPVRRVRDLLVPDDEHNPRAGR
jgi:hypothetical protein